MMSQTSTESTPDPLGAFAGPPEELHPDLVPWVVEHASIGRMLKHPLVYDIFLTPLHHRIVNQVYEQKKKALDEAAEEANWAQYVFLHERPYRLHAFVEVAMFMKDAEYWALLGNIWTDSENIWECESDWIECLESDRPERLAIMDSESDLAMYDNLPTTVTVYRGVSRKDRIRGLSWTTNRKVAEWFARRFDAETPMLCQARVSKQDVIASFTERNESEVVVLPEKLKDLEVQSL